MKKVLGIILDIILPLAAICMGAALFFAAYTKGTGTAATTTNVYEVIEALVLGGAMLVYILIPLGAVLFFSKKDTLSNIGLALLLGIAILYIASFVYTKNIYDADTTVNYGAGIYIGLVGAILTFVSLIVKVLLLALSKENEEDKTIDALIRYKDLLSKGIITEAEFVNKRDSLLGEKKKESKK